MSSKRQNRGRAGESVRFRTDLTLLQSGNPALDQMPILELAMLPASKRVAAVGPVCCCPPPQANRLGGCRPGLKRVGDQLEPICQICLKPLVSGIHRRRDQTHVIGLSKLPADHLDLDDLVAAGLLLTPIDPGDELRNGSCD